MTTEQETMKTTEDEQRAGTLVRPEPRLSIDQVRLIDGVSRDLLVDPGLLCYNARAAELLKQAGAKVDDSTWPARISMPPGLLDRCLETAPARVVLGARERSNRLILDAHEPRVRFGSGAETNVWLDVTFDGAVPKFTRLPGSIELLGRAAHLCEHLENLDFFIRCVSPRPTRTLTSSTSVWTTSPSTFRPV